MLEFGHGQRVFGFCQMPGAIQGLAFPAHARAHAIRPALPTCLVHVDPDRFSWFIHEHPPRNGRAPAPARLAIQLENFT